MSHAERKPERVGDKQGPNVGKGSRCPCAHLFYHFGCQSLTTSAFSPYLQICRICTFSSLLQLVLYPIFSFLITSPFGAQYSHAPIFLPYSFSSPRSSFSVSDRRGHFSRRVQLKLHQLGSTGKFQQFFLNEYPSLVVGGKRGRIFLKNALNLGRALTLQMIRKLFSFCIRTW